jgi:7-cyano-7-deazaguanine synthase in queuosine biosynthesis
MTASSAPRVFLCNDAPRPPTFPAETHVTALNYLAGDPKPLVALHLPKFVDQFNHLPARILDLLELAAYVFAADRAAFRGAKDAVEYHAWSRAMFFVVKVRDAAFWNQPRVKEKLSKAIRFMTGDFEYTFDFLPGHTTPPASLFDKEEFAITRQGPASVALFSGGLDSLAGVLERLETTNEEVFLISHRSGLPSTKRTQASLAQALRRNYPGRVHPYSFDCGLANERGAEETQRTRAFLFGSIAFAVAHRLGLDSFFAYENGVTSLNFIRRQDLMSARASRTTHPQTHALMADFLSEVHGGPVKVVNPFWTKTKADVFTILDRVKGRDLISSAVSCSKTFQRLPGNATHCGCCFQCVDRRIAAYAAGLQDIDNAGIYSTDIFKSRIEKPETRTTALDYVRQAVHFATATDDGFVRDRLAELSDVTPFVDMEEDAAVENVWTLCHRHGVQVVMGLSAVRQQFDDLRYRLEDGSLLQLMATRAYLADPSQNGGNGKGVTLEVIHAGIQDLKQGVDAVRLNTEAIAKNEYELRQENAALQELADDGFLRFATRVEADDFRAFAAIMLTGNRNQAAQALSIPLRSFYDLVNLWPSRGPDYKRMYRMAEWRKKVGRKIKVRLDDSLLGTEVEDQAENPETIRDVLAAMRDKTDAKNRDDLLRDILQAIAGQNAKNWQDVQAEVIRILREEVSQ